MNEKRNGALDRYPIEKKRAGRPSVTVKEDGAVIFYLYAPAAKIVQVAGLGGYFTNKKIDLMPDGQGGFFAEVQDFHWGMHYYFWYVDGVRICNPYAGISYGCFAAINTFEVQEKNVDFYFAKDARSKQPNFISLLHITSGLGVSPQRTLSTVYATTLSQ